MLAGIGSGSGIAFIPESVILAPAYILKIK